MSMDVKEVTERVEAKSYIIEALIEEVGKAIVGQKAMVEGILVGLLANGHILLEGVPGLAKTTAVKTVSKAIELSFKRIQFTPDLLPADLIGTLIFDQSSSRFTTRKGPIFANVVLADEINRAPAKVQSALLEAMQERQVTIGDTTYPLPKPFMVMATQNPIEQEGTYPLPEAQVDRFMLKIVISYPDKAEERAIMDLAVKEGVEESINTVVTKDQLFEARAVVNDIYMDEKIKKYIVELVHATRKPEKSGLISLKGLIEYGASPRASIYLAAAAKARAFLRHRGYVTPEDIKAVAFDVMRHRIIITYEAEAEERTSVDIIREILDGIEVP